MLHKISTYYSVFTFEANKYEVLKNNIKDSRIYTHYIDTKVDKAIINQAYTKYLCYKNYIYTENIPEEKDSFSRLIFSELNKYDMDRVKKIKRKLEFDDYYYLDKNIEKIEGNESVPDIKQVIKKVMLIEDLIMDRGINMDDFLEYQERSHLAHNFISEKKQRYFLLPFLGELDSHKIEPMVILTLYDIGILTFEIIIGSKEKKLQSHIINDTHITLEKVKFYELLSKYRTEDYFNQYEKKSTENYSITFETIIKYYKKMIEKATGVILKNEEDFFQLSHVIGVFSEDNEGNGLEIFMNKNLEKFIN